MSELRLPPLSLDSTIGQVSDYVHADMVRRWRSGERLTTENYVDRFPALAGDPEAMCDVAYQEFLLHEQDDADVDVSGFVARFASIADTLAAQIEFHRRLDAVASDQPTSPQAEFPGYEISGVLASGGMSTVYLARQVGLDRFVAIKYLSELVPNQRLRENFVREAHAIAKIAHPNIVNIFDVGAVRTRPYLVLEYVPGGAMSDHYRGHALPAIEVAKLMSVIARAIGFCHELGIFHRDLKPANILLQAIAPEATPQAEKVPSLANWIPKVTDFGLSKLSLQATAEHLTIDESVLGTPSYMAPEQVIGEPVKNLAAIDIYGLGAILYEMLSGRPPYQGTTALEVFYQVVNEPLIPPGRLQRGLPRDLETICMKCLCKAPSGRYAGASQLADDLDRFIAGEPIHARRAGLLRQTTWWCHRHAVWSSLAAAALIFLVAWSLGVVLQKRELRQARIDQMVMNLPMTRTENLLEVIAVMRSQPADSRDALVKEIASRTGVVANRSLPIAVAQNVFGLCDQAILLDHVVGASAAELSVLVNLPGGWSDESRQTLWQNLLDDGAAPAGRLRAAAVLATHDHDDGRWTQLADLIAEEVANEPLSQATGWADLLWPIRHDIAAALSSRLSSSTYNSDAEPVAATVFAHHTADDPVQLANQLLDASTGTYRILLNPLPITMPTVAQVMNDALAAPLPIEPQASIQNSAESIAYTTQRIRHARRRAVAAISLAIGGQDEALRDLLDAADDLTARTYAIESLAACGLSIPWLRQVIDQDTRPTVLQACVLAMGQYNERYLSKSQRSDIRDNLRKVCQAIDDPGLVAAVDWLQRRWQDPERILLDPERSGPWETAAQSHTWVNSQGTAFSIIQPQAMLHGSPGWEEEHEGDERTWYCQPGPPIAFAQTEITVAQMRRWQTDFPINPRYSFNDDHAMGNVSFYSAAKYCRWLSEREGVSEDQMCFPAIESIGPAMIVPVDYRSRTGYRLPTEAEWEYACRGGTLTSWSFGLDKSNYAAYANCILNNLNHVWPVATGKPNPFGLFDMHGNLCEWCLDRYEPDPGQRRFDPSHFKNFRDDLRVHRGGSFGDFAVSTRSARRNANLPEIVYGIVGMRIVRTLPLTSAGAE